MHITMFPAAVMLGVLMHGDLGTVEHRWFIHVVPRVQIKRAAHVLVNTELAGPKIADLRVDEIGPSRRACGQHGGS